jgi:hypothetical protein
MFYDTCHFWCHHISLSSQNVTAGNTNVHSCKNTNPHNYLRPGTAVFDQINKSGIGVVEYYRPRSNYYRSLCSYTLLYG